MDITDRSAFLSLYIVIEILKNSATKTITVLNKCYKNLVSQI